MTVVNSSFFSHEEFFIFLIWNNNLIIVSIVVAQSSYKVFAVFVHFRSKVKFVKYWDPSTSALIGFAFVCNNEEEYGFWSVNTWPNDFALKANRVVNKMTCVNLMIFFSKYKIFSHKYPFAGMVFQFRFWSKRSFISSITKKYISQ